jgi:hypothetical protein
MALVVLGVDPPQQSHTATALVAGSHQQLATLGVPASLADYRPAGGAGPGSARSGAGRSRTPAAWAATAPGGCLPMGRRSRRCPPPPPRGSGSCRGAWRQDRCAGRRRPPQRSRQPRAMPPRCSRGRHDVGTVLEQRRSNLVGQRPRSVTSSMRCCANSSPLPRQAARRPGSQLLGVVCPATPPTVPAPRSLGSWWPRSEAGWPAGRHRQADPGHRRRPGAAGRSRPLASAR